MQKQWLHLVSGLVQRALVTGRIYMKMDGLKSNILPLLEMFTKILLLLSLSIHTLGGLRHTMTTVIPQPHVTIPPTDIPLYRSQHQRGSLYYLR